jgi:predicted O-linked N-acetylglucosamine transferase (SPINDLY family)
MSASLSRKLKQAQERLQQGDLAGGEFLCEEILRSVPRNPDALWLLAMSRLMSGRTEDAVPLLEQVVAVAPRHGAALENLGLARLMLGQYAEAEHVLRQAAALSGAPPSVAMRLGAALLRQGRAAEAAVELKRALQRNPEDVDTRLNLGEAHARLGEVDAARREFERVLAMAPGHPDALFNLGVLDMEAGARDAAQRAFEKVLASAPDHIEALVNLSVVMREEQRLDEALKLVQRALALAPSYPPALDNLGQTLHACGRHAKAREALLAAVRGDPERLSAREGLVLACFALHRFTEAIPQLREILRLVPDDVQAFVTLANALFQCGELDEARVAANRAHTLDALAVSPYTLLAQIDLVQGRIEEAVSVLQEGYERTAAPALLGLYTHQLRRLCEWERWRAIWPRFHEEIASSGELGSPFYVLCEDTTAREQLEYTRRWAAGRFRGASPNPPAREPRDGHRLRVGYLSSDFHEHPAAYLLAEVFELHDRDRFEIYAYSYGPDDGSTMRARLRVGIEHFVDIAHEPDDLAVERIRSDGIDLLVDLHGYTVGDRLTIMAQRPCAVQATWLGYPCTTGAPFVDYLIADPFVIPEGRESEYAAERVVRLPHCYQPNDRKRATLPPLSRREYGLPDEAFVFCCFNQVFKITPDVYAVWMRLLHDVPGSVLWLVDDHPAATRNLKRHAAEHGIGEERLVFAGRIPLAQHLARYRVADLALDTFPYTSHTTASDALWAECPLVGLCGDTFPARVSASILTNAGLGDLVTHDLDDYYAIARSLASDASRRREVRARIEAAKSGSPLFDTVKFTRDLETLYESLIG